MSQAQTTLEIVGPPNPTPSFWAGRKVLVTGHTGFKGSWLSLWLTQMGAVVTGLSLDPATVPSHFDKLQLGELLSLDRRGDVRDAAMVCSTVNDTGPDIVFHLAAQPIVSTGYDQPVETFEVNIMGTIQVLEAVRLRGRPCAVIVVTSDKCYEPHVEGWAHREADSMGGRDPYSASKGAAEIVAHAYRRSYFGDASAVRLATVRAGNVIGGGDWARDRLVPDAARSLSVQQPISVRNPGYVRPWQHVLEPLCGYLLLAEKLVTDRSNHWDTSWNLGPGPVDMVPVRQIIEWFIAAWGGGSWIDVQQPGAMKEVRSLRLSIDKVVAELGWHPRWSAKQAAERAARWYHRCAQLARPDEVRQLSVREIEDYVNAELSR